MNVFLTLFLLFLFFETQAQQDPLTTQFWNNYAYINPATSGLEYKHSAALMYRENWRGVSGAPTVISANYNILIYGHHGLGMNYVHEETGFNRGNYANLNYNYQFVLGEHKGIKQKLSLGVAVGLIHSEYNGYSIGPISCVDDPKPATFGTLGPNFNAGIAYKGSNLFAGFGVTHLTETSLRRHCLTFTPTRHYYLMGRYLFQFGKSKDFELKPQVLIRTDAVKIAAEINLFTSYSIKSKQKVWLGTSFRSQDALAFMVGLDINKQIRIGYSYDYTISKLSSISRGTNEVVLGLMLK